MPRHSLGLIALLLSAACVSSEPELTPELSVQALTSSEVLIALRTHDQYYVTREDDGALSTNRNQLGPWERWVLSDLDGPPLESGDQVTLRFIDRSGTPYYIVAENGGGPGSVAQANRREAREWETFLVQKAGGGPIVDGDAIHLKASVHPYYLCAERAGGLIGWGSLVVDRGEAREWETFTFDVVQPSELCPFTGSLCLFDHPNFEGERFTAKANDPQHGACVDLAAHGWGGRARSAVNTNTVGASVMPNADCTGHPIGIGANDVAPTLPLLPNGAFVF